MMHFTTGCHYHCHYPEPQQFSPHISLLISWGSVLILFFHISLGLPSGLFSLHWHTKTLFAPLSAPTHATYPVHLIILDLISWILCGEEYRSWILSLCTFLQSFVSSSFLVPKIFLSTLFSNTSLNVSYHTSYLHKTTGKSYSSVYFNLYIFG